MPEAQPVPGNELTAVAASAGIPTTADTSANLSRELTPLPVSIKSNSDQPVRVRHAAAGASAGIRPRALRHLLFRAER